MDCSLLKIVSLGTFIYLLSMLYLEDRGRREAGTIETSLPALDSRLCSYSFYLDF